eukprot:scaffold21267_cov32-Tisochrysis_lutea.AAC.3
MEEMAVGSFHAPPIPGWIGRRGDMTVDSQAPDGAASCARREATASLSGNQVTRGWCSLTSSAGPMGSDGGCTCSRLVSASSMTTLAEGLVAEGENDGIPGLVFSVADDCGRAHTGDAFLQSAMRRTRDFPCPCSS